MNERTAEERHQALLRGIRKMNADETRAALRALQDKHPEARGREWYLARCNRRKDYDDHIKKGVEQEKLPRLNETQATEEARPSDAWTAMNEARIRLHEEMAESQMLEWLAEELANGQYD